MSPHAEPAAEVSSPKTREETLPTPLPEDKDNPFLALPDEIYTLILSKPATFHPRHFDTVAENLIKNPNITSSCIFRADFFYDSSTQAPMLGSVNDEGLKEKFEHATKHLKEEFRPRPFGALGEWYSLERTVVRKMVPRNPSLDKALVQTCHFYSRRTGATASTDGPTAEGAVEEERILIMIPHMEDVSTMPFYHPKVLALALRYTFHPNSSPAGPGNLSIYYRFSPIHPLDTRLQRTALNLLTIIHKHATGQAVGYIKRVHHDQIVPQARFQDTYTRLKLVYAKALIGDWAEQTDPTKHVFEDLGIAAFLIELWRDTYPSPDDFPGFVDIGCGNGVLVSILIQEGYRGWGFDARARKSWAGFPDEVRGSISARILAPSVLKSVNDAAMGGLQQGAFHDGQFPAGTFIVSNHADELTPWTPLLAYLNFAPFIAIPCCSHNLAGARCRFSVREKSTSKPANGVKELVEATAQAKISAQDGPGPKSGSLARPKNAAKQPSAYQSLTTYVSNLAAELGFEVRKEMLRIPSTRNAAIVGKPLEDHPAQQETQEARIVRVRQIVKREVGEMDQVVRDWLSQAEKISKRPSGH
jgi:tRNASer (uridine44-2'-O)-methyltransferase